MLIFKEEKKVSAIGRSQNLRFGRSLFYFFIVKLPSLENPFYFSISSLGTRNKWRMEARSPVVLSGAETLAETIG